MAIAGEVAFLMGSSILSRRSSLFGVVAVTALTDETNSQRTADNLSELRVSPLLQAAAQAKANDMAVKGYFSHTSPDGLTPWYWFRGVGYNFSYAGENLAINFSDSQDVTNAWMNSPEHRANILNSNFTEIGMATAQGNYNGIPSIFIVELFGTPGTVPIAVSSTEAPTEVVLRPITTPSPVPSSSPTIADNFQQTFAAIKGVETGTVPLAILPSVQTSTQPAVSVQASTNDNNPIQNAIANPKQSANYFYLVLIGLFTVALVLNIFIKMRIQHPDLILGGVTVLAMTGIFIIYNQQLFMGFVL